jgi:hypothetical protein
MEPKFRICPNITAHASLASSVGAADVFPTALMIFAAWLVIELMQGFRFDNGRRARQP